MAITLNPHPPGRLGERAQRLGNKLGCTVFERLQTFGHGQPAVVGATGDVAKQLTDYGGLWSSRDGAVIFPSWTALEGVLDAIVHAPPVTAPRPQMPD